MSILAVPSELLLLIGENLSIKDLYHFLLTCGELSSLLTPLLEDLGVQDVGEQTSLQWAAKHGHATLAKLAILRGAEIDVPPPTSGQYSRPVRKYFTEHNYPDAFLSTDGKMDATDIIQSGNPLHLAVQHGYPEIARILVEHGATVDAKDIYSRTPLHLAGERNDPEAISILAGLGATIDARDERYRTPLYWAAGYNCSDAVRSLVSHGATIDAGDAYSRTPLHLAAERGNIDITRLLVTQGATINAKNWCAETPLHSAAKRCNPDVIRYLISHGAAVDALNWQADTPAHRVASRSCAHCLEVFIEGGFPIDTRGGGGQTIIHHAAAGRLEVLRYLLRQKGAEMAINLQDSRGSAPLHVALTLSHILLLLAYGADGELKNKRGDTPYVNSMIGKERLATLVERTLMELRAADSERGIWFDRGKCCQDVYSGYSIAK